MNFRLVPVVLVVGIVAVVAFAMRTSWFESGGLRVGEVLIPSSELDQAIAEMSVGFPQFGEATLRWAILDGGFGPAWILHQRLAIASEAARQTAVEWRQRLLDGEDFLSLVREQQGLEQHQNPCDFPGPPRPDHLGGRVCATVASLREGEWAGPVRTLVGWELVFLDRRFDDEIKDLRNRAGVRVARLRFEVGKETDRDAAKQAWNQLPLSGSGEILAGLPANFRADRTAFKN